MDKKLPLKHDAEAKISLADRIMHSDTMLYIIEHKKEASLFVLSLFLAISLLGWWHHHREATQGKYISEAKHLKEKLAEALPPTPGKDGKTKCYADLFSKLVSFTQKNQEIRKLFSGVVAEEALIQNLSSDAEKYFAFSKKELLENNLSGYASLSESAILLNQKRPREALQIIQKVLDDANTSSKPILKAYCYIHKIVALRTLEKTEEKLNSIQEFQTFLNSTDSQLSEDQKNYFLQTLDHGSFTFLQFLS